MKISALAIPPPIMRKALFWVTPFIFILTDSLLAILCLAFYHPYFHFDANILESKLFLMEGYDFTRSPIEFIALCVGRSLFLVTGIFLLLRQINTAHWSLVFLGVQICNLSFSLVKILAFSEHEEQLTYYGVWMSLVWNVLSFLVLYALWKFGLNNERFNPTQRNVNGAEEYERLVGESQIIVSTESVAAAEPAKEDRASTWAHILLLLKFCGHYWRWLAAGFAFLMVYSAARIFIPLYTAKVIALIVSSHDIKVFIRAVVIMSVLTILSTIFGGLRGGILNYTTGLINNRIRRDLFRSITEQEIAFFDEAQTGEIISRLTADCEAMSMTISSNLNIFLRNIIMVIGSVILMISISWRLTLVTFVAVPPIAFFTKIYSVYYERLSEQTQNTIADANRVAEEVISSMRTVRSFACERKECSRFEANLHNTLSFYKKKSLAYMGFTWVNEMANNVILIAVLCYGGYLVLTNRISVDGIIAFLLYQMQLGENFYLINSVFSGLMESVGASRKVFQYLNRKPKIQYDGSVLVPVKGNVEFKNVSFSYPTRPNFPVLQDVSFNVQPGETVALVGPSGAGKSSIISLLQHFYESQTGQILLDNTPIRNFDHTYYHQKVALVAQEPTLYAGSVRYNILYGCDEMVSEAEMIEAAKLANIHDFIIETELGYDTKCGEKGIQMSGGQKQRIAIARALVRKPVVLILDEATSALDAESEHIIQEAITKCSIGRTVIVIAHRLSTVEKADRIMVIERGKLIQCGPHEELMRHTDGLYFLLVQRQLLHAESDSQNEKDGAGIITSTVSPSPPKSRTTSHD